VARADCPPWDRSRATSDHAAIRAVSEGLRTLLADHLSVHFTDVAVDLRSPKEVGPPTATGQVSVWLYRVTRSDFASTEPPVRPTSDLTARWPIPVNLCYLVTPIHQDPSTRQELLGLVLQTFNDHSILAGGDVGGMSPLGNQVVRVAIETLAFDEMTHIWHALHESYQPSLAYQVQYVSIDSAHAADRGEPAPERSAELWHLAGPRPR
jgi:hypothetical protein